MTPELLIIQTRLQTCSYGPLKRLDCFLAEDGAIVVRGTVPSFYLKQVMIQILGGQTTWRDEVQVGSL